MREIKKKRDEELEEERRKNEEKQEVSKKRIKMLDFSYHVAYLNIAWVINYTH